MEENIEEENLNKSLETQSENTQNEITPNQNLETINSTQATENMEVHHHAHNPAEPHHKKNWKSYFWEFLMLFLAVFCGFLAEYQLEHKIEKDRAKDFAISLVKDLQNDITAMDMHKKIGDIYCTATDSLLKINGTKLEGKNASKFSFYTRFMYWTGSMNWNRATFEQIKNSGSLRYFKNYQLLQKLMKYNATINDYEDEYENRMIRGNILINQINKIIDPQFHKDLSTYKLLDLDTMSEKTKERFFTRNVKSLETKREVINEMTNMSIVQQRNIRFINNERLLPAKELAIELIANLKKEYHLENK